MINLAGVKDCDLTIIKEIEESGLKYNKMACATTGEVGSNLWTYFQSWNLQRLWYYWAASTETTPLLFKHSIPLHESDGEEIRVGGYIGGQHPLDGYSNDWDIGVNSYHIDTQKGLNKFIETVKAQTVESKEKNFIVY